MKYSSELLIHRFRENKGTAIAFKTGIIKALETGCEFIWLMDDDTVPETGALNALKKFRNVPANMFIQGITNKKERVDKNA